VKIYVGQKSIFLVIISDVVNIYRVAQKNLDNFVVHRKFIKY